MYNLRDSRNRPTCSAVKGTLGGNSALKIYGRLDCPSALRHIAKGHYVSHRVFFLDEATAIAAGYRPCGACMPAKYAEWKELRNKQSRSKQPHAP
jgi:methylphosphotriester-DNA--protein-cysteine methyltransferase